jgi:hypothetical protein
MVISDARTTKAMQVLARIVFFFSRCVSSEFPEFVNILGCFSSTYQAFHQYARVARTK